MRISKWKLPVKIVCFGLLLALLLAGLNVMSASPYSSNNSRWMMRDLYEQERIDAAFLGSSVVYRSCNPEVFSEVLGFSCFNLASSRQRMQDSYYLLRETMRLYQPKYVFYGASYKIFFNEPMKNQINSHLIFDYMKPSLVKAEYLVDVFTADNYLTALLQSNRLRGSFTLENVAAHLADWKYYYETGYDTKEGDPHRYMGKGFITSPRALTPGEVKIEPMRFDADAPQDPTAMEYLGKILDLCNQNGAELILFTTPMLPASMIEMGRYEDFNRLLSGFAQENGLLFMDFNYILPEHITYTDEMFNDNVHINDKLHDIFSRFMGGLLNEYFAEGSLDMDAYFYPDFDAFYQDFDRVAAIGFTLVADWQTAATAVCGPFEAEYRFSVMQDNGVVRHNSKIAEYTVIREYSPLNSAQIPADLTPGKYFLRVEARPQGSAEEYQQRTDQTFTITEDGYFWV